MERLTEVYIDDNGGEFCALVACKEVCAHGWTEDESGCRCDKVGEMQIRLAAYEDIGTVEELAARVEVVRCYDCRYWLHDIDVGHICGNTEKFTRRDDFCSYGQRRE